MTNSKLPMQPIKCDRCGQFLVCLLTFEDPNQDYMPMLFCSLDCLEAYMQVSLGTTTLLQIVH